MKSHKISFTDDSHFNSRVMFKFWNSTTRNLSYFDKKWNCRDKRRCGYRLKGFGEVWVQDGTIFTLQWHHDERDGVSNDRRLDCLLKRLFRRRSRKTSKFHVIGYCEGNPPMTGGSPHKGSVTRTNVFHLMMSSCGQVDVLEQPRGLRLHNAVLLF